MVPHDFVKLYEVLLSYDADNYWEFIWYVGFNPKNIWRSQMSFWWNNQPVYIFKED